MNGLRDRRGRPAASTQEARRFFEAHLRPTFRFTVTLQEYIEAHPGLTFQEIAEE